MGVSSQLWRQDHCQSRSITSSANGHSSRTCNAEEDAEAVMAKALEGRSDSDKEEALSPEPKKIPAPREIPVEAMK